ncbi:hypothetical protein PAPYR_1356 [Paratrimastix pyriformis]|uniref:Uncharacterized protein n=1 Tax=Paratrimastix pyriformis TaxID=342808 RepID=A0ABQ8UTL2_9EUKA|nr:hypothetical protein PAPYR_1356 [Paratrimastix pyriformis]
MEDEEPADSRDIFDDLQFEPQGLDALDRDFNDFQSAVQSQTQYDGFRKEYEKVQYALKQVTESVNRWIGRCKSFAAEIKRNGKRGQEDHAQLRDFDSQLVTLKEDIRHTQASLEEFNEKERSNRLALDATKAEIENLGALIDKMPTQQALNQERVDALQARKDALKAERDKLDVELVGLRREHTDRTDKCVAMERECIRIQTEAQEHQAQIGQRRGEADGHIIRKARLEEQLREAQGLHREKLDQLSQAEHAIKERNLTIEDKGRQLHGGQAEIDAAQKRINDMVSVIGALNMELAKQNDTMTQQHTRYVKMDKEVEELQQARARLEKESAQQIARSNREALESEHCNEERRAAEAEKTQLAHQIEGLELRVAELNKQKEEVRRRADFSFKQLQLLERELHTEEHQQKRKEDLLQNMALEKAAIESQILMHKTETGKQLEVAPPARPPLAPHRTAPHRTASAPRIAEMERDKTKYQQAQQAAVESLRQAQQELRLRMGKITEVQALIAAENTKLRQQQARPCPEMTLDPMTMYAQMLCPHHMTICP